MAPFPNRYRTRIVFKSSRINMSYAAAAAPVTKSIFVAGNTMKDVIKSSSALAQPPPMFAASFAQIYSRYFVNRCHLKYELHTEDNGVQTRVYHWSTIIMPDGQGYPDDTTHNGLIRAVDPNMRGPTKAHTISTGVNIRNIGRNSTTAKYATRLTSPGTIDLLYGKSVFVPGTTATTPAEHFNGYWQWNDPDIIWLFQMGITRETFASASAAAANLTLDVQTVMDVTFMDRHQPGNWKLTIPYLLEGYTEGADDNEEAEWDHADGDWVETTLTVADRELRNVTKLN